MIPSKIKGNPKPLNPSHMDPNKFNLRQYYLPTSLASISYLLLSHPISYLGSVPPTSAGFDWGGSSCCRLSVLSPPA